MTVALLEGKIRSFLLKNGCFPINKKICLPFKTFEEVWGCRRIHFPPLVIEDLSPCPQPSPQRQALRLGFILTTVCHAGLTRGWPISWTLTVLRGGGTPLPTAYGSQKGKRRRDALITPAGRHRHSRNLIKLTGIADSNNMDRGERAEEREEEVN